MQVTLADGFNAHPLTKIACSVEIHAHADHTDACLVLVLLFI